jgi:hypothetical protein
MTHMSHNLRHTQPASKQTLEAAAVRIGGMYFVTRCNRDGP